MSENPYSPPAAESDLPEAPPTHGWTIHGSYLLVSNGALLPMIDLYNGESQKRMTLHPLRIKKSPFWISGSIIACVVVFLVVSFSGETQSPLIHFILWTCVLGVLTAPVAKWLQPDVALSIFLSSGTVRRFKLTRVATLLLCGAFLSMYVSWALTSQSSWISQCLSWIFGSTVVARILLSAGIRHPCFRRKIGPLFEIRGLHPDALTYLREHSNAANKKP
jgi:hypothetical protein